LKNIEKNAIVEKLEGEIETPNLKKKFDSLGKNKKK
jgi:hypothetical protein